MSISVQSDAIIGVILRKKKQIYWAGSCYSILCNVPFTLSVVPSLFVESHLADMHAAKNTLLDKLYRPITLSAKWLSGKCLSAKCLSAKWLLAKWLLAKCLSAKWLSAKCLSAKWLLDKCLSAKCFLTERRRTHLTWLHHYTTNKVVMPLFIGTVAISLCRRFCIKISKSVFKSQDFSG